MKLRSAFWTAMSTGVLTFLLQACGQPVDPNGKATDASSNTMSDPVSIRAFNGAIVCADLSDHGDLTDALIANRNQVGPWETFDLVDLGKGKVALRAANGKYVCADRERGNVLYANRDAVGEWETFELLTLADDVKVLRASDGSYVCADLEATNDHAGLLIANRAEAKEWESFKIEPVRGVNP